MLTRLLSNPACALVLVSDGHIGRSEYESLNQLLDAHDLGQKPQPMPAIVQTLCEDLLKEGFDGRAMLTHVGDGMVAILLAEVDDIRLQSQVVLSVRRGQIQERYGAWDRVIA